MRHTTAAPSAASATAAAHAFRGSAAASLSPMPRMSPAAAAPMPTNSRFSHAISANWRYRIASIRNTMSGGTNSPPSAAAAPAAPRKRVPTRIATFPMFGPGSSCATLSTSVNSRSVSQRSSSTIVRCAYGSTPPMPESPMRAKPQASERQVIARGGRSAGAAFSMTRGLSATPERAAMRRA